jgi:hypothetical protein
MSLSPHRRSLLGTNRILFAGIPWIEGALGNGTIWTRTLCSKPTLQNLPQSFIRIVLDLEVRLPLVHLPRLDFVEHSIHIEPARSPRRPKG